MTTNPWDITIEAQTQEDGYCADCDIGFIDLDTAWYTNYAYGEAECPICTGTIEIVPDEHEEE